MQTNADQERDGKSFTVVIHSFPGRVPQRKHQGQRAGRKRTVGTSLVFGFPGKEFVREGKQIYDCLI